jgi:hypothetical protein
MTRGNSGSRNAEYASFVKCARATSAATPAAERSPLRVDAAGIGADATPVEESEDEFEFEFEFEFELVVWLTGAIGSLAVVAFRVGVVFVRANQY